MVEHVYNPETELHEQLGAAARDAAQLRRKLDRLTEQADQDIVRRQLTETEARIRVLQDRLRG